jgi:membrane protein DedA with SNARE-associated domain
VQQFLMSAGYGAIFVLSFISAMGLPVGAELALIYGGVLASTHSLGGGKPLQQLVVVIIVATLGEVLGSMAGYSIGRFGGRTLVDKVGKYVLLTHKDLDVSFAAGLGEMALAKFTIFTVIGCAVWCVALCSVGYNLGTSYHHVLKAFSFAGYVIGALAVIAVVVVFWHRLHAYRSQRDLERAETEV